jgi:hypothetical protein
VGVRPPSVASSTTPVLPPRRSGDRLPTSLTLSLQLLVPSHHKPLYSAGHPIKTVKPLLLPCLKRTVGTLGQLFHAHILHTFKPYSLLKRGSGYSAGGTAPAKQGRGPEFKLQCQ